MVDFKIKIVDKIIRFKADTPKLIYDAFQDKRGFKYFLHSGTEKADLTFDIKYGYIPEFKKKKMLFSVDDNWYLSNYNGDVLFEYPDRGFAGRMERVALINEEMTEGIIYVNKPRTPEQEEKAKMQKACRGPEKQQNKRSKERIKGNNEIIKKKKEKKTPEKLGKSVISEIKANFFQAFLVEYIISKEIGFLVHCSSVYQDGKLYLFMGQTHAGKSTIADFWQSKAGATVFNDDRAILSFKEGRAYFYNAPWVGSLVDKCAVGKGNRTEIDKIFFIYQHAANALSRLNNAQAAAKIFKNSFPVFWKKEALHYVLGNCAKIVDTVPCYDLGFVHNDSAVKFLKEKLNAQKTKEAIV